MKFSSVVRDGLTPANALGWPTFWLMLVWSVLANLFDSLQSTNNELVIRLPLVGLVHLATWAVLWAIVWCGRVLHFRVEGWSLFSTLLIVAGIRGFAAQLLLEQAGVTTVTGLAVRVTFSVLYVGVGIALTALWIHQVRRHNHLLETMFGEQERLYQIKFEAEQKIIEANESLIANIKSDLLRRVDALQTRNPLEALAGLRDAIDQVVRPMSQQLAYSNESWTPEPAKPRRVGVSWLRVMSEAFSIQNIQPGAVTLATAALIAPTTIQVLTLGKAWSLLILVPLLQFAFLTLFKRVTLRLVRQKQRWIEATALVVGFLLMGVIAGVTANVVLGDSVADRVFTVPTVIYTLLIGAASVLLVQAQKAMAKVEQQLESTTAEASWQITRIKQKHRELEHALANQLHGKIQGALAATYLKLAAAIKADEVTTPSLQEFKATLTQNILRLGDTSSRPLLFDEAIDETKRTWANVCAVSVEVSSELHELIYRDSLLCHALEDLLPELAFNAVKHGRAKNFEMRLELTTTRTVRLTATDDGTALSIPQTSGIGSKLLDDCCITWDRQSTERGTTVVAELPLNRIEEQG